MKYIVPFLLLSFGFFYSCADDNQTAALDREQAQKVNDSILNIIHSNWNYNIAEPNATVKSKILDWQKWSTFVAEINQKPVKSLNAYRNKVENLTKLSDELKTTVPLEIGTPAIQVRLNNLNTNIKHLNSFISLQTIPTNKVIGLNAYIKNDINGITNQIEELVRIKNIPLESGEKELFKKAIDTTRRANFKFENDILEENTSEIKLEEKRPFKGKRNN